MGVGLFWVEVGGGRWWWVFFNGGGSRWVLVDGDGSWWVVARFITTHMLYITFSFSYKLRIF